MNTKQHFLLPRCTGMNCGVTGANHSPECRAEHAAAVAGGRFVKDDNHIAPQSHAIDCEYVQADNPWAPCTCGFGGPNDAAPIAPRADADTAGASDEQLDKLFFWMCTNYKTEGLSGFKAKARDLFAAGAKCFATLTECPTCKNVIGKCVASGASNGRADAEGQRSPADAAYKDAALTDDQIREIWLRETGFDEQAAPFAIIEFARAILAAKEKKS